MALIKSAMRALCLLSGSFGGSFRLIDHPPTGDGMHAGLVKGEGFAVDASDGIMIRR